MSVARAISGTGNDSQMSLIGSKEGWFEGEEESDHPTATRLLEPVVIDRLDHSGERDFSCLVAVIRQSIIAHGRFLAEPHVGL